MMTRSFEIRTGMPDKIVAAATSKGSSRSTGVLFLTGDAAQQAETIAQGLARRSKGQWLIARCPGALTERGEVEHESAAVGMAFPENHASVLASPEADRQFGARIASALADAPGSSVLTLLRGDETNDDWLVRLDEVLGRKEGQIFGGGVLPHHDIWTVHGSHASSGRAAALMVRRPWLGRVTASSACRLLSPLFEVTHTQGPMLVALDDAPALARLGEAAQDLEEQSLVLLAIATDDRPLGPEGRQLAMRAIHGVDPTIGGLMVGEELPLGTKLAFAVRDAHGARNDLQAHVGTLRRSCAGTAPAFGIYVSCAGRGRALYDVPHVDVKLIVQEFPNMPLVGLHSTFELAPMNGRLTPQIYTGVLAVFCAPS